MGISAQDLAKVFRVDLKTAKQTLQHTTQYLKRSKNPSLHRWYSSNNRMLRYTHIREYFYMDTMFASQKSGLTTRETHVYNYLLLAKVSCLFAR